MNCLLLMMVPAIVFFILTGLNWFEFSDQDEDVWQGCAIACGVLFLVIPMIYYLSIFGKTHDTEIWNGQVLSKSREQVHCRHSYSCNCSEECEGEGKNESCHEECETCYEHPYDVDWDVHTSIDDYTIDTLDSQGLEEPPRWTSVKHGDPVAESRSFTNYVAAAKFSLFHDSVVVPQDMLKSVPDYPDSVYDYYNLNRALSIGTKIDTNVWSYGISLILRDLGPTKQANIIIVFVGSNDITWASAVRNKWNGAKKNDIVITLGLDGNKIIWTNVYSWSDSQIFKVVLRDDINKIGTIAVPTPILNVVHDDTVKYFQRKHMKDFEYLKKEIDPNTGIMLFLWILAGVGSGGILIAFFVINKEEEGETKQWTRRRTY